MNAAVTIETRSLDKFPETVSAHMKHLPGFELVIFGSDDNEDFLSRNISNFIHHKVKFPFFHQFEYNLTLTNPKFWEILSDYERVVIFQHDSMILRDGIDEFLQWDYVGSPWKFQQHGGNGGLSVRNPKVMLSICRDVEWKALHGNEDVYFCNYINEHGYYVYSGGFKMDNPISSLTLKNNFKLAPREVCSKFSCETIFQLGTLGYHSIDSHLTPKECEQIKNQYEAK